MACSMQNQGGRPDPFYHVNDISVNQGRQLEGGGVPNWKNAFCARIHCFEPGQVHFSLSKHSQTPALGTEITRKGLKLVLSIGDPSPPLSTGIHWCHSPDKMDPAFPSVFAKPDSRSGNKASLHLQCWMNEVCHAAKWPSLFVASKLSDVSQASWNC